MSKEIKKGVKEKIPLATAIWANVYRSLIKDKVKFPKNFNGIGAAYGGLCEIQKTLEEYGIIKVSKK